MAHLQRSNLTLRPAGPLRAIGPLNAQRLNHRGACPQFVLCALCVLCGKKNVFQISPSRFALSACGGFRGNRAPCAARAPCASVRPLGVHEYAVGSQSCAIRRKRLRCARLRPRSPPRMARFGVRRVAPSCLTAPSVLAAVRRRSPPARFAAACGAMPRRGIPLLASRSHAPPSRANRLAPSPSARSVPRRPAPHPPKRRVSLRSLCGAASASP